MFVNMAKAALICYNLFIIFWELIFLQNGEKSLTQGKALGAMLLAGICWSFSSFFIKLCPWSAFQVACVRGFISSSALTLYLLLAEKKHLVINKTVAFVSIFVCFKYIGFISANKLTAAANAVAMYQLNVIFILVAGCVASHSLPRKKDVAIIAATIIGIVLFFLGRFSFSGFLGNILAGLSGFCTAVLFFMSARFKTFEENLSAIILGSFLSAVLSLFLSFGEEYVISPVSIGSILFLGLIQQSLAFICYTKATRVLNAFTCSIISSIEPVFSPIICFLLLGEAPGKFAVVGAVIVIGSITLWSITDFKAKKQDA
jgi:drug/metabolite transporter (DMT)-like permease